MALSRSKQKFRIKVALTGTGAAYFHQRVSSRHSQPGDDLYKKAPVWPCRPIWFHATFTPRETRSRPSFTCSGKSMKRCDSLFQSHGRCIRQSCFLPDPSLALYLDAIEKAEGWLSS